MVLSSTADYKTFKHHDTLAIKRLDWTSFENIEKTGEIEPRLTGLDTKKTQRILAPSVGKKVEYGLRMHKMEVPGHGTFWGHDGTVWGAGAMSMIRADGMSQMSVAVNLLRYLGEAGAPSTRCRAARFLPAGDVRQRKCTVGWRPDLCPESGARSTSGRFCVHRA
jgi:hypothetical protein